MDGLAAVRPRTCVPTGELLNSLALDLGVAASLVITPDANSRPQIHVTY
jgi:hypothetical protein